MNPSLRQDYYRNLKAYLKDPSENSLYQAYLFSSSIVGSGAGPDEIVEIHSEALDHIVKGQSAITLVNNTMQSFTFLLEVMITYGLIHKEYLDTRDAQITQLKANIETIQRLNHDLDYRVQQAEAMAAIANILTSENDSIPQAVMEISTILHRIYPGCIFFYQDAKDNQVLVYRNGQAEALPDEISDTIWELLRSGKQPSLTMENNQHTNIYIPIKTSRIHVVLGVQYLSGVKRPDTNFCSLFSDLLQGFLEKIDLIEQLKISSIQDSLTGLYNHRFFEDCLCRQIKLAKRSGGFFSFILIDVDNFKAINDKFGHLAGDMMLKKVASIMKECARSTDMTCRYGGDEFAIILPDTTEEQAVQLAKRISWEVRNEPSFDQSMTISIGIAEYAGEDDVSDIIRRADLALYQAKQLGKDRVV